MAVSRSVTDQVRRLLFLPVTGNDRGSVSFLIVGQYPFSFYCYQFLPLCSRS